MNKRTVLSSLFAGIIVMSMAFVGCSKKDDDSSGGGATSSDLTISGSLATSSLMSTKKDFSSFAVNLSDLEIYAIAFTNPPAIGQADVAADGSFTVNLTGAKGSSVTAVFRDKTNNNEVGVVTFVDSSKKDMSGNAKESSSIVLSDSVNLGNLVLGDDGSVKVNVSDIQTVVAAPATASTAFDMTGRWYASAYANPPTGYETTCAEGTPENECNGPGHNMPIDLIRFAGKEFTPNTGACDIESNSMTCGTGDGTVSDTDRFALGVWEGGGPEACGYKTGFSADEARAGGFIHLVESELPTLNGTQMTFGDMTGYDPYFWVKTAATAQQGRDFYDCSGISVTVGEKQVPAYACKGNILNNDQGNTDTGNDGWMVNLGNGGCFDSTGKPVRVTNWSAQPVGSCTNVTDGLPTGFSRGTCSYNSDPDGSGANYASAIEYTCSWVNGQFADASGSPNLSSPITGNVHVGPPTTLIAGGASCGVTNSTKPTTMAAAQCAAQYYEQNRDSISSSCGPRPRFNWGASNVADFYRVDYRAKPDKQFLMDVLSYDASGALATMDSEERESFTETLGEGTVTCEVARKIVFNVKKTSDTTAVVDIRFTGRMASTAAVCQSLAKTALENVEFNKTAAQNDRRRATYATDLEYLLVPNNMIFNVTKQ